MGVRSIDTAYSETKENIMQRFIIKVVLNIAIGVLIRHLEKKIQEAVLHRMSRDKLLLISDPS